MFLCKIFFKDENEKAVLSELLSHRLIKHYLFFESHISVATRKLWKLYWLNHYFKKYSKEFGYEFISTKFFVDKHLPSSITTDFSVEKEMVDWYTFKVSIAFPNINNIWKIIFLTFNK